MPLLRTLHGSCFITCSFFLLHTLAHRLFFSLTHHPFNSNCTGCSIHIFLYLVDPLNPLNLGIFPEVFLNLYQYAAIPYSRGIYDYVAMA